MSHLKKTINQSINQIKIIMKNSLLILGITLVSLTNVCNATNTVGRPVNSFKEGILADDNGGIFLTEKVKIVKPSLSS